MLTAVIGWLAILFAFIVIDAVWLGVVARDFYRDQIGAMMREDILFPVAGLFYAGYAAAVLALVVLPAARTESLGQAVLLGAVLGLCAYGTYDVTNLATLRGWPVAVTLVDMAWGAILTGAISAVGYWAVQYARLL